jgi:ferredoxin-NADP reductase
VPTPIKLPAQVAEIAGHAEDLRSFVMIPERRVPCFLPGQFLHLALDPYQVGAHWPESRVFSIASSPHDTSRIRITVSRQGAFTTRMFTELTVGSRVWLKLPYGAFCPLDQGPDRMVFLAGGSGVTPFISFLEWARIERPRAAIDLHYGARSPALLIYREAIARCQTSGLSDLKAYYYAEDLLESGAGVVAGRLSIEQAWSKLAEPLRSRYYLSGPKAMIDKFRAELVGRGVLPGAVISDEWA